MITYSPSAIACTGSEIVTVYSGWMKRKSSVTPDSTAAKTAGQMPPMSATITTSSW